MKFNERRVGFGMGLLCVLLIIFSTMNMGADKIHTGFWEQTHQQVALTEVRSGATTTFAKTRFCADRPTEFVFNEFSNITATTRGIVIDLSDTTGYAHGDTGFLTVHDLMGTMCIDGATGKWNIRVGIVVENDATDGTVWYFWAMSVRGPDRTCESITYRPIKNIHMVMDGATPKDWSTGKKDTNDAGWDNDDALPTFIAGSTAPNPGDVVIEFEEVEDGSALEIKGVQVQYAAHSN